MGDLGFWFSDSGLRVYGLVISVTRVRFGCCGVKECSAAGMCN